MLADMAGINNWDSLVDAVQANGVSSCHTTPADLHTLISAVMDDSRVWLDTLTGTELRSIEQHWTAASLAEHISDQRIRTAQCGRS